LFYAIHDHCFLQYWIQRSSDIENVFDETIELLKEFSYSRYIPLLYVKRKLSAFEEQQQKNVRAFMMVLLVNRLESSFFLL